MQSTMHLVIERLREHDRESAHAMLCAFKEESQQRSPVYDELRADYKKVLGEYLDEYQSRTDCNVLVAKTDGKLIGIIMGSIWNYLPIYAIKCMGYIPELYIVREFRGRGVGTALIRAMEEWFRQRGARFSRIETIRAYESNRTLYERLGYEMFLVDLRRKLE